jgi:hypothetical protein
VSKTPPLSFYLKSLFFSPTSILIMLVTLGVSFFVSGGSISLFGLQLPFWLVALGTGGILEIMQWIGNLSSEKFKNKVQKDWSLKSLATMRNSLREASKSYERLRGRPNYQRVRYDRVRKLEKDMFADFSRMEVWDNDVAQEVLSQSIHGFLRYYELLNRDQRIAGLLENANIQQIQEEIDRLHRQASTASSSEAVGQYQRAAGFKQQELKSLDRIRQSSILLQAHLDTLESALSSLRTRLVNTTVWGGESVRFELSNLTQELMALEMAMEELEGIDNETLQIEKELNIPQ